MFFLNKFHYHFCLAANCWVVCFWDDFSHLVQADFIYRRDRDDLVKLCSCRLGEKCHWCVDGLQRFFNIWGVPWEHLFYHSELSAGVWWDFFAYTGMNMRKSGTGLWENTCMNSDHHSEILHFLVPNWSELEICFIPKSLDVTWLNQKCIL